MTAYYNENDPKAAAWLRELMKADLIVAGDVDERSIEDVTPMDVAGYDQCHFFAGIGGWSYALRLAGWEDTRRVWTGSCPCQPFSAAGKGKGFSDERHLWPVWFWLIGQCQPPVVFGEQVASKAGLGWFDSVHADLEGAGYACGAADLCAAGVGAPHIRQRLYFVAHRFEERRERGPDTEKSTIENKTERSESLPNAEWSCFDGVLAVSKRSNGQDASGPTGCDGTARAGASIESGRRGVFGKLGDDDDEGLQMRGSLSDRANGKQIGGSSAPASADDGPRGVEHATSNGRIQRGSLAGQWSAVGGCEYLPCIDGKARPVEPGTFPLAHGVPHRVGLLRGYGNAIVPQVAQAFIESYMTI